MLTIVSFKVLFRKLTNANIGINFLKLIVYLIFGYIIKYFFVSTARVIVLDNRYNM